MCMHRVRCRAMFGNPDPPDAPDGFVERSLSSKMRISKVCNACNAPCNAPCNACNAQALSGIMSVSQVSSLPSV